MTPPPSSGSLGRRRRNRSSVCLHGASCALATALLGLQGTAVLGQSQGEAVWQDVERFQIEEGPELWVAEGGGPGPVGIALVFPGGGGMEVRSLAHGVSESCPGEIPAVGAGPEYTVLSLTGAPDSLVPVLGCLGAALPDAEHAEAAEAREAVGARRSDGGRSGEGVAAPFTDLQAYRTASGVLLTALYHPAPVPGGSFGVSPGGSAPPIPSHLVVAGSVATREVIRGVEAALARRVLPMEGSAAGPPEASDAIVPRPPVATEVLVLDRPGESLVEVRAGQLVLPGNHPDWSALVVAREILADRLGEGPWGFAELLRVRGPGAFVAGTRLPIDVLPGALDRLLGELATLRDRLPAQGELRAATARLTDSFTVATREAPGLADELARVAALGLGPEAVVRYPARLAALTPDEVRRAARRHLDPSALLVAAAGDGAALSAELSRFGPVRTIVPPPPPEDWPLLDVDGGVLAPWASRYRVQVGGRDVGTARREVIRVERGRIWFRSTANVGDGELSQDMRATLPELDLLEATTTRGGEPSGWLRREGERLLGTRPGGRPVELSLPPGTVVADLLEPTLWASTLEVGASYRVPVAAPSGEAVEWAGVQVLAAEVVQVPAGSFETLRVSITGPEILTLWLRREPPHRTVRLLGANGVVMELLDEDEGGR